VNEELKKSENQANRLQILIGIVFLLIGGLVYLADRPPDLTYFVYRFDTILSLYKILPNLFGFLGNWLPDFIHVFSFILITAGIVSCGKKGYLLISFGWLIIDCGFELGQKYNSLIPRIIPDFFKGIPILEAIDGYFCAGTFDYYDIIAIFLGTTAAYFILLTTMERTKIYEA
jgi:hypothetical protein